MWLIIDEHPGIEASVDLVAKTITLGKSVFEFEIDDYTRWRLREGLDDIGLTLRDEAAITEFESRREAWRPTTLPAR
jgi:3-isopropylmalate/(R)-2-methylmalate dehydratase small subunit